MTRARQILGLFVGLFIVLSSGAHSFLGWKQLSAQLVQAKAPPDLILGLGIGWHFAGAAMLVFGCIVIWTFVRSMKRKPVPWLPVVLIALLYMLSGFWAYVVSSTAFFVGVFLVPGLLRLVAAWGGDRARP